MKALLILLVIVSFVYGDIITVPLSQEKIFGNVFHKDGVTPMVELPIKVWDIKNNKVLYRTRTDTNGMFTIPAINKNDCQIFIGRLKINIVTLGEIANSQNHDIIVVLPDIYTMEVKLDGNSILAPITTSAPMILNEFNLPKPPLIVSP